MARILGRCKICSHPLRASQRTWVDPENFILKTRAICTNIKCTDEWMTINIDLEKEQDRVALHKK